MLAGLVGGITLLAALTGRVQAQTPAAPPVQAQPTRRLAILFVSPDDPDRPYIRAFADGLREGFTDGGVRVTLYRESYDQLRFGDRADYASEYRTWLFRKYRDRRIDAIVVRQQAALRLFAASADYPWGGVPLVYSTLGALSIDIRQTHPTASGLVMANHFPLLLDTIRRVLPETRRIVVIRGDAADERVREAYWLPQIRARGFEVEDLSGQTMPKILNRVASLPQDAVPLVMSFQRDGAGDLFEPGEVQALLAPVANRPLFLILGDSTNLGLLGGPLVDYTAVGRLTAAHVLARLAGAPPTTVTLPVSSFVRLVFEARELQRYGIPESRLPAGSTVRNRPPDLWRDHRNTVLGALAVGALQAGLVAAVLIQRGHRTRAQAALRVNRDQLQELTGQLITAQESERARIARELHDDYGQRLASVAITLSSLRHAADTNPEARGEVLVQLQRQLRELASDLRQLSHDLHPGVLEHVGLVEAVRTRCLEFAEHHHIHVQVDADPTAAEVPQRVALCLYRVVQEALRNVATHASAASVVVQIRRTDTDVTLTVRDDGQGFDASRRRHAGLGLVSLAERLRLLGGTFHVHSVTGHGTTVRASVALEDPHATDRAHR